MLTKLLRCLFVSTLLVRFPIAAEARGVAQPVPDGYEVRETFKSRDGKKAAYIILERYQKSAKRKARVYYNGAMGRPYDDVFKVAVSPDGRSLLYCARKGSKEHFVLNGRESRPFDTV